MSTKKGIFLFVISYALQFTIFAQTYPFAKLEGSPLDTAGWFLAGDARIGDTQGDTNNLNDELILVPANTFRSGACFYKKPVNITSCQKWVAEFDFRMWQGTGADGIAFFFLNNPPASYVTGGGMGIPPRPLGLIVGFDTWQNCNAASSGPVPKIQIRYGNGVRNYNECPTPAEPTISGIKSIRRSVYNHAKIVYDFGNITVFLNDTLRLTGNYNINFAGYFGLTASTGGSTDLHSIKNFVLYTQKPLLLAPNAGADKSVCKGASTVIGTAEIGGNYSYKWYPTTGLNDSSLANPTLTFQNNQPDVKTITYFVTKDTLGGGEPRCAFADEVKISFLPKLNQMPLSTVICAKTPKIIGFNGISGSAYSWLPGQFLSGTGISNPIFYSAVFDTLDTELKYTVVATHPAGCTEIDTVKVLRLGRFANAGPDATICGNDTVNLGRSTRLDFNYSWFQLSANSPKFTSVIENPQAGSTRASVSNLDSMPVSILYRQIVLRQDYNCRNDDTIQVRIFPKPVGKLLTETALCPYDSALVGSINQSKYDYLWENSSDTNSFTKVYGAAVLQKRDTVLYRRRAWAGLPQCSTNDSINIVLKPLPEIFKTSDKVICPGDSTVLGAGAVALSGYSYNWTPAQNLNETNKAKAVFYAGSIENQSFNYILTNTLEACKISDTVVVKVWNKPTFTAASPFRVCAERSQKIGPDSLPGYSYKWLSSNFLSTDSIAKPAFFLNYPSVEESELKFAIRTTENQTGCQRIDSITTILQTKPPANAGSDLSFCSGDTITIGIQNFLVDMAFSWTGSNGIISPQTAVSAFSLLSNSTVNQLLVLKLSSLANGCIAYDTMQIRVKQLPDIFKTADKVICPKDSVVLGLQTTTGLGYSHSWFPAQNLNESNQAKATFFASSIENQTLSYILTNTLEACSVTDTVNVKVWNVPLFSAENPFRICSEISKKIGPDSVANYQYKWLDNLYLTQDSIANPSIFLRYQPGNEDNLKYALQTKEKISGCMRLDTIYVALQKAPLANAGLDVRVCSGDTILIGIQNPQTDLAFAWSGSIGLINPLNAKVLYALNSTTTKNERLILKVQSLSNNCVAFDTSLVVVNRLPEVFAPDGRTNMCASDSVFTYINPLGQMALTSFSWRISGGKILNSNDVNAKVTWFDGINKLSLLITDSLGCRNESAVTTVEVNPKPNGIFTIGGPEFVCPDSWNDKSFELNGNFSSSRWFAKGGVITSSNSTSSNINFIPEANKFQVLAIPISDKNCKGDTIFKEVAFAEIKPEILSASVVESGKVVVLTAGLANSTAGKIRFNSKSINSEQSINNEAETKIENLPTQEVISFGLSAKDQCLVERQASPHSIIAGTVSAKPFESDLQINTSWTAYSGNVSAIHYELYKYSESIQNFERVDTSSSFGLKINGFSPFEKPRFKVKANWLHNGTPLYSWSDEFETGLEKPKPIFPSLFTPNGDGANDNFFIPYLYWYPNSTVEIFDRWGNRIFKTDNYLNDWTAQDVADGIYFFSLTNNQISERGWVQIKR